MKKIIFLLILILYSFNAYGLEGGESEILVYKIQDCYDSMIINVSAIYPMDEGEYNLSDCEKLYNNTWKCPCDDIKLQTKENTINNYSFEITYNIQILTDEKRSTGSGLTWLITKTNVTTTTLEDSTTTTIIKEEKSETSGHSGTTLITTTSLKPVTTTLKKENVIENNEPILEKKEKITSGKVIVGTLVIGGLSFGSSMLFRKIKK